MPGGQIEQGRIRQDGPNAEPLLGTGGGVKSLLIFKDPLFDSAEHGVRNKELIPGYNPSDFVGLDSLGWGVHPDGSINVVDPNECFNGFGVNHPLINWSELWHLEAQEPEIRIAQRNLKTGYKSFLDRMIKSVKIDLSGVVAIPDPRLWVCKVVQGNSKALGDNVTVQLVPWTRPTPEVETLRRNTFATRPTKIEFKGRKEQRWPQGKSPAE